MNHEQILEQVLPWIGGKDNVSRSQFLDGRLYVTVKDTSVVVLDNLGKIDSIATVKINRSRLEITLMEQQLEGSRMAKDYNAMAKQVIEQVGGKQNITFATHCMTRLRLSVADKDSINIDGVKKINGVLGAQFSGDQFQIIIGQTVGELYDAVCQQTGLGADKSKTDKKLPEEAEKSKKISAAAILDGFTGCLTPALPILIAGGMLKVIVLLGMQLGILAETSGTYVTLNFVSDAAFYFLPVFIGGFAAKKFNANIGLGMLLGALLIHPTFVDMVSQGSGGSIFGIPIYAASYSSTILPSILGVFVLSKVEHFFAKRSPASLRSLLEPFCTMLIMVPLTLCVIAPIGAFLGNYVAFAIDWLMTTFGFVGVAVLAALCPFMILTGMHVGLTPFVLQQFTTYGYSTMNAPIFINNFSQGAACAAVAIKTKNVNLRSEASACAITAIVGGVCEPALFGITLKYKTPLYASMIGCAVGGAIAGLSHIKMYAFPGSGGLFSLPAFVGPDSANLIWAVISFIASVIVSFIACLILYRDKEEI
jgi:phosphotransferase system  glucose/maltose/N-acetylglucosamine-specific IIC component/phosphotransferase system IIB component